MLWARAENIETLTSSFIEIVHLLDLPEQDSQEQDITIQAVKRWLQWQHSWMLILDSADNPCLLPAFLPSSIGGHVLITTRVANLSTPIAGVRHSLAVEAFSDDQAALFLLHRANLLKRDILLDQAEAGTQQLALAIAHELGGLPLALDMVGAYLEATGSSLASYQHLYGRHRAEILQQYQSAAHPGPIASIWDTSFHNIEQHNPAAADLLRLCAFLAPDAIPEEIITIGAAELGSLLAPVAVDPFLLNEAITYLHTYSLLTRDPQTQMLSIHRLVQAALRENLSSEDQQQWMRRAVHVAASAYSSPDFAKWPALERLLPHALLLCYLD